MDYIQTLYGKCRCCQETGEHRDVFKEYYCDGSREVYCDIFLECFNLFLSTSYDKSNLICADCIQKLRDASDFRKMVVDAEKQLLSNKDLQNLEKNQEMFFEPVIEIQEGAMEVKREPDADDYMETEDKERKDTRSKKIKPLLNKKAESKKKSDQRPVIVTEKTAYIDNALLILENSNVTAFKGRSREGLPCFYCKNIFDNIEELRTHQKEHNITDIKKSLHSLSTYCLVINVDITYLKCTLCDTGLNTLKDLQLHLESKHNKKFYPKLDDRLIPFKIPMDNNYICQICGSKYDTFGSIERHMNEHFRNYNCDKCDTGFVTGHRLNTHIKTAHVEGNFECETCKKVFPSQLKLKNHVDTVHKMVKRFKCSKCSERFTDYFRRYQHLVAIHGQPQVEYKCNVCDKVYIRRYMLSQHMKRDHMEERSFECEICFAKFFARKELNTHMVKHNGARIFECSVCKKAYARKKTLREHMRIHDNDRRFCCAVCGQAFVQNCSLKGHMKTRHPEVNCVA